MGKVCLARPMYRGGRSSSMPVKFRRPAYSRRKGQPTRRTWSQVFIRARTDFFSKRQSSPHVLAARMGRQVEPSAPARAFRPDARPARMGSQPASKGTHSRLLTRPGRTGGQHMLRVGACADCSQINVQSAQADRPYGSRSNSLQSLAARDPAAPIVLQLPAICGLHLFCLMMSHVLGRAVCEHGA